MKYLLTLALLVTVFGLVFMHNGVIDRWPRWTVEPMDSGKWVSCMNSFTTKSCSSPMSYDEASWWSETHGGKDRRPR